MTRLQEALRNISKQVNTIDYTIEYDLHLLAKLVDKDVPKKPIYNQESIWLDGVELHFSCPVCDKYLLSLDGCSNNECRQKIDWSDFIINDES